MVDIKELREKVKDLKVLFVDDEKEIQEGTGTFLKKFFNNVAVCENGEQGLNYFQNNKVDIVITDVLMPKMDGITMVKEIKKLNPEIFIVFITAFREKLDEDSIAIDIHIKKPLSYDDMILVLNTVAQKYGK